jgi:hypothetical protein
MSTSICIEVMSTICMKLGRRYVGIELSPEFAQLSRARLASVVPQTAYEPI